MLTGVAIVAVGLVACGGATDDGQEDSDTGSSLTATISQLPPMTAVPSTAPTHGHVTETTAASSATATSAAPAPATPTQLPDSAESEDIVVHILDFSFDPSVLTIPAGTTVTFVNDGVDHTATAKGESPLFDSGIMKTGDQFTFTFDTLGDYDYWCLLHPDMAGTVVVN